MIGPWTSYAQAQDAPTVERACASDQSRYWLCRGDRAWATGYLVEPLRMGELVQMADDLRALENIVVQLRDERAELRTQRDDLRQAVEVRDAQLREWETWSRRVELFDRGEGDSGGDGLWVDRVLWGSAGVGVGVLVGVLVLGLM